MAEIQHKVVRQTTLQTTTSSTYVNVTGGKIAHADLTNGKKYLLVVTGLFHHSSTATSGAVRVLQGSNPFARSEKIQEMGTTTTRCNYFFFKVFTHATGEDIQVQFKAAGGNTCGIDNLVLFAMNLSDDLTENTDWFSSEDNDAEALPTDGTWTPANNASVTFTPAVGGKNWLVLAMHRVDPAEETSQVMFRLKRTGTATETVPDCNQEPEDSASDAIVAGMARVYNLSAASHTFTQESRQSALTTAAGSRTHSAVFALNMAKFKSTVYQWAPTVLDITATSGYGTEALNVTLDNMTTGDVWVLASCSFDADGLGGNGIKVRLQVDDTDTPTSQTGDAYDNQTTWDAADLLDIQIQDCLSLNSGNRVLAMDSQIVSTATGRGLSNRLLVAIGMELVPTSNTPPVAIIDSISDTSVNVGEEVDFAGHGTDADGDDITEYEWESSIDGVLSDQASFSTDTLSAGTHTIQFRVRDERGDWSSDDTDTVTVSTGPGAWILAGQANPGQKNFVIAGLQNGLEYDVQVKTVDNSMNESSGSSILSATPTAPPPGGSGSRATPLRFPVVAPTQLDDSEVLGQ